ncbi:MAG: alpha/beta fold hydrolase [Steroidobacteraceae bacterium]
MSAPPPARTPLAIEGPAGTLEALLEDPGGPARCFGVVCHPHPLHGGTMDNKVVHTLARALHEQGMPTLRFNYRGVGRSTGAYDDGRGETDDALAVIAWGRQRWPGAALALAGFSFGAAVALRAALAAQPAQLITVAPAVTRLGASLPRPACPWLLVIGDADDLVDCAAVRAWAGQFQPPPALRIFAGGDHFFHGRLQELRTAVGEHLAAQA